jgi:hypothetical protein
MTTRARTNLALGGAAAKGADLENSAIRRCGADPASGAIERIKRCAVPSHCQTSIRTIADSTRDLSSIELAQELAAQSMPARWSAQYCRFTGHAVSRQPKKAPAIPAETALGAWEAGIGRKGWWCAQSDTNLSPNGYQGIFGIFRAKTGFQRVFGRPLLGIRPLFHWLKRASGQFPVILQNRF